VSPARTTTARWVIDDNVPNNEQPTGTATSVYALLLGRQGVFGIVPKGTGNSLIRVEETCADGRAREYVLVHFAVGLALATPQAIARLQQVDIP
jgi:hypothetical protein